MVGVALEKKKTELRAGIRERAGTWSEDKMSSRKKGQDKDEGGKSEWVDVLEKRLVSAMELRSEVLLKKITDVENKMNDRLEVINQEMEIFNGKIKHLENKTNDIETDVYEKNKMLQEKLIWMECRQLDKTLRIRGLQESQKEVREKVLDIISEMVEIAKEKLEKEIEEIYRINSEFACIKKLPRDVIIKVTSYKLRDLILSRYFQEPPEVAGKKIKIWKELPREVIQQRKNLKPLVEKLKQEQISFRWELPVGISFMLNSKKIMIRTIEQMQEFLSNSKINTSTKGDQQRNQNGN